MTDEVPEPLEDDELFLDSEEDEETEAMEQTTTLLVFGEEGFFD